MLPSYSKTCKQQFALAQTFEAFGNIPESFPRNLTASFTIWHLIWYWIETWHIPRIVFEISKTDFSACNPSGETRKRRFMLTCLKNGGPCAVSSRAWCSFFNVMRLGPIVSATGCCSVPFFASKEVLSTLVSHGNSLRSIQLNWAFGGLLQYAQEMNWEQKIDISEHQKASKSKSIHAPNDAILVAYGTKSGKASNHDALSITVRCNWAMHLASLASSLFCSCQFQLQRSVAWHRITADH